MQLLQRDLDQERDRRMTVEEALKQERARGMIWSPPSTQRL